MMALLFAVLAIWSVGAVIAYRVMRRFDGWLGSPISDAEIGLRKVFAVFWPGLAILALIVAIGLVLHLIFTPTPRRDGGVS